MTQLAEPTIIEAQPSRLGYLPYLDGVRGVAILMVLAYHADAPFFKGGFIGVDVFFVLSGFLITSLLIKERDRDGRIDLPHFYTRRALRLLPAVVTLLVVFLIVSWFVADDFRRSATDALIVLFYGANWARSFGHSLFALGHTWSLSIEEQFYLVWPVAFILLSRAKLSRTALVWLLLIVALCLAVERAALTLHGAPTERLYNGLDTHSDALLIGCSLAFFLSLDGASAVLKAAWIRFAGYAAVAFLLVIAFVGRFNAPAMFVGGYIAVAIATAVMIVDLQARAGTVLRRVTEWPVLVRLGRISYGVYLWHFPIYKVLIALHNQHGWHVRWPLYLFGGGTLAILVAIASYRFIETPFLRLKRKYQ